MWRGEFSVYWDSAAVEVLADGQGNLHKYFRSQKMPQGAHAHFGLPHWPGLGGFGLRAQGEGGDLEEDRRPAWPVQSHQVCKPRTASAAAVSSAAAATDHRLWGSGSCSSHYVGVALSLSGLGTGTRSTAQSAASRRHTETGSGAGRTAGMCLFQRCQEVS